MGGAIVSEPRESFSRGFLRSNSHFKQWQGISSPSRVIFTCFSAFQQPFQATSRIFFTLESHFHVFFYVAIFFTLESHFHLFFYVPRATSSNGKEFLHLRESSSRAFRRSNSHFKQLQGFASPSRIIFTCFSTFQQPFQATSRIFFTVESHLYVFFYVPTAISSNFKDFLQPPSMHHMPPSPP